MPDYSDTITFTVPLNYRETKLIVEALRHYIFDGKGTEDDQVLATKLAYHMNDANEKVVGKEYDPTGWKAVK